MSEHWSKVIPDFAPGWVGPLSRKLDGVFFEQASMTDTTEKPLPPVRVLLPARAFDDLERSIGGFPVRGVGGVAERPRFRGCELLRVHTVGAPTIDCSGKVV